ncbi:serine/threonine-protein kinase [Modestobacter marinus]|uniref:serine/threonine-protein kinase n=1 Tax=Modestobacter marinus TaxID=477641 RepID=UPI001C93AA22|nr:serine/threonine-protein kinase [Modestobacter marinus]
MDPQTFGPYRLEALIGHGGMGEVYRAYDTVRERTVALKRLRPEFVADERYRARFLRECHGAAGLTEAHVIPIHDFGEIDGRLYLDMRLIEGQDLGELLATLGPLPPHAAVDVVEQVAAALDAAHRAGLVHRDVKPSNVLLGGDAPARHCYLADFGLTGKVGHGSVSLTATGTTVGTLDYIAPERLTGRPSDHRVDVYSLACLLHEALTGHPPFEADELPAMIHSHLNLQPPPASALVAGVPATLDAVIARGMAKDPDARYGSAGELAAAARAAISGPVAASPMTDVVETGVAGFGPVPPPATGSAETGPAEVGPAMPPTVGSTETGIAEVRSARARRVRSPAPRRRRRLVSRLLVLGVLVLALGAVIEAVTLFGSDDPTVVRAEAAGEPGEAPFTPPASEEQPQQAPPPGASGTVSGDAPGLYGGSGTDECRPEDIASFLDAHPDRAAAWAGAQGIQTSEIRSFLGRLTSLTLRADTAVTNYGYRDGVATPIQSVLQAGTAVLVDERGAPRVRCACGNPLGPPAPRTAVRYEGATWSGFSPRAVTVVRPAPAPVQEFVIVEPDTQAVVARPCATTGQLDHPVDPAAVEAALALWRHVEAEASAFPAAGGSSSRSSKADSHDEPSGTTGTREDTGSTTSGSKESSSSSSPSSKSQPSSAPESEAPGSPPSSESKVPPVSDSVSPPPPDSVSPPPPDSVSPPPPDSVSPPPPDSVSPPPPDSVSPPPPDSVSPPPPDSVSPPPPEPVSPPPPVSPAPPVEDPAPPVEDPPSPPESPPASGSTTGTDRWART